MRYTPCGGRREKGTLIPLLLTMMPVDAVLIVRPVLPLSMLMAVTFKPTVIPVLPVLIVMPVVADCVWSRPGRFVVATVFVPVVLAPPGKEKLIECTWPASVTPWVCPGSVSA